MSIYIYIYLYIHEMSIYIYIYIYIYIWRRFGVFIVNYEHISHFVLVFLLLTLNK